MKLMTKRHRVTFDSEGTGDSANTFIVHKPPGPVRFGTSDFVLCFNVAGEAPSGTILAGMGRTSHGRRNVVWQTGDAAEDLTRGDVVGAGQARRLQQTMAFPSDADFKGMVRGRMLRDCDITTRDITNAKAIFGPAPDATRGKTTRHSPMPARAHYASVSRLIRERNLDVDIIADLFFINGLAFLVTRSRRIRFVAAEVLADQFTHTMSAAMAQVVNLYKCFGFNVHTCFADGQFAALELGAKRARGRHQTGDTRVIKERVWLIRSSIPCSRLPRWVIIELVMFVVF